MASSFFPGATQPVVNGGTLQAANELFIYNDHRSAVQAGSDALASARQQYDLIKGNKERCKVLIQRCQNLVDAVSNQIQLGGLPESMRDNIYVLANVCISVRDIIANLASQPFAWRLLNQDKTDGELKVAESSLLDAISIFHVSAQVDSTRLQREIADSMAEAAATDQAELISHLNDLSQNDYKILHSLQENHMRTEELLVALTKHVQNIQFTPTPSGKFMRNAVGALQRLSKAPITTVSAWQLTSLEVTFNRDDLNSQVGQGSFGTVFKGLWQGEVVAIKEMYIEDARSIDRNVLKSVHNEIAIWSRLSNPRILQFYGACLEATRPFLVSRLCQNGNILDYLKKNPSKNRLKLMHEVSVGMLYLHNKSIIHADLKGANILINYDGTALISDFGISHLKDQAGTTSTNNTGKEKTKGTLRWMAPELMEGEKLNFAVDVYSFGITVWEVYTLEVPFSDIPERAFYRRVIDKQERPKCPPTMDTEFIDLVSRCWAHDATERPTFKDISSSIWTMVTSTERLSAIHAQVAEEKHMREQEENNRKLQAAAEKIRAEEARAKEETLERLWQENEKHRLREEEEARQREERTAKAQATVKVNESVEELPATHTEKRTLAELDLNFNLDRARGGYTCKAGDHFFTFEHMKAQFGADIIEEHQGHDQDLLNAVHQVKEEDWDLEHKFKEEEAANRSVREAAEVKHQAEKKKWDIEQDAQPHNHRSNQEEVEAQKMETEKKTRSNEGVYWASRRERSYSIGAKNPY